MQQSYFSYNHQDEDVVKRYERMLSGSRIAYFDVEEFEVIAEHYLDHLQVNHAFEVVRYAVHQHPQASSLKMLQAKVWFKKGEYKKALDLLDNIGLLLSSEIEFWMLKAELLLKTDRIYDAIKAFDEAIKLDDAEKDQTCIDIAYQFLGLELYDFATRYLKTGTEFNPKNTEILFELGSAYVELEQYEKALHYFNLQLDIDPYLDETWFTIGLIYWDKFQDVEKAMEAFDFVTVIQDGHEMAIFFKGQICFKEGDYHKAIEYYHAFGEASQQTSQAELLIAECYEEINESDKAISYYKKALEDKSSRFDAWLGLGYCYLDRKEYNEAIHYFKKVLNDRTDFEEAWSGMGDCFFALGQEDLAIQAYEKSLAINPIQPELWSVYADIFISLGEYTKAVNLLLSGMSHAPKSKELMFQLAICHFQMCEFEEARNMLISLKANGYKKLKKFYEFCPEAMTEDSFQEIVK